MTDRRTAREGGFTLIEIVIAVAIVATTVAAGFGISLASRSLAVSTAAGEFDQFLDSARTIARDLDGATLAFTVDAYGDGTEVRVLAGGPNAPPTSTTLPTLHARATIEEAESLGKAPFAFIVHANGSLSGRPGYRVGDTAPTDVGCPASGAFHFIIKAAGGSADRYVPCRIQLAANGPVTLATWPLAPIAPNPTPCSGPGCTATSLPSVPASTASCPPNFTPTAGGCAPAPPASAAAHYHVTISGAPASINVGASGSFTAQATLTNPTAVAAGTPASIPVGIQSTDPTCAATPSGWQPSGSAFTVTGIAAGTCTVTIGADTSAVAGSTTDIGTVSLAVSPTASPSPIPSAASCDLTINNKCYQRLISPTSQVFNKYVAADSSCGAQQCSYIDSIRAIWLDAYSFMPTVAPNDDAHELLFRIDRIDDIQYACMTYAYLSTISPADPLVLYFRGIGEPANPPLGFGQPSVFTTVNHVFVGAIADSFDERALSNQVVPTVNDLIDAFARAKPGEPYSFTYHNPNASPATSIIWLPDFPSCDNAGDTPNANPEYGDVSIQLSFEIFQARP